MPRDASKVLSGSTAQKSVSLHARLVNVVAVVVVVAVSDQPTHMQHMVNELESDIIVSTMLCQVVPVVVLWL